MPRFAIVSSEIPSTASNQAYALSFLARVLLRVLSGIIWVWNRTLRLRISPKVEQYLGTLGAQPGIILLWHNRLFMGLELCQRYALPRQMAAIVSASKDGAWMGAILENFGIHPVRGSSSRRGASAFRGLLKAQAEGHSIVLTPDGSKGPKYCMKPGAAQLAREAEMPLYLLAIDFKNAWRLKSWDRFYIPKPFSEVSISAEKVEASEMTTSESLESANAVLQLKMNATRLDAELPQE